MSDSEFSEDFWIDWFLGAKGNEYFCDIDPEFILDRFNLTGLETEIPRIRPVVDIITDKFKQECSDAERENLERLAWRLYGLVHARYVLTPRGLQKMNEKFRNYDFGKCPRYNCKNYPLLPIGLHDIPAQSTVKLYCAKCEDLYVPKSSRHAAIDGAYFGSSFPGMLLQAYPNEVERSREKYLLKIFGFKLHERAELARIQDKYNQEAEKEFKRLEKEGL